MITSTDHNSSITCQWHHWCMLSKYTRIPTVVGNALHQWVVPGNIHQELSLLQCMDYRNRYQRSIIHSILQAQIYNKCNRDTWRFWHTGSATNNRGTQSKIKDNYEWKYNQTTKQTWCNLQHNRSEVLATKIKTTSTDEAENPNTTSEGAGGTGAIFKGERRNITNTHIGRRLKSMQENCQTTTNSKLHYPRWRLFTKKLHKIHHPRCWRATSKEHTVQKLQYKNIDTRSNVSMYGHHNKAGNIK